MSPSRTEFEAVYGELRRLAAFCMASERGNHTLQPTALVHEAYLKLASGPNASADPVRFRAYAARAMRQVLVEHARRRRARKRGADPLRITLSDLAAPGSAVDVDALDLHRAIESVASEDPRAASVVEMRFFGGMTEPEIATSLGVCERTVRGDWIWARTLLEKHLRAS